MHLRDTAISHTVVFIVGSFLGLLVTRLLIPQADSESCRKLGIETGARSYSSRVPSMSAVEKKQFIPTGTGVITATDPSDTALELFAQSGEDEARRIVRVNGTYNKPSPYRGPPSRAVDTAWERYWKTWMFSVDEKAYLASRPEHPTAAVRLPHGQYLATFEATHQLHCLYNLFRASYRDYYPEEQTDYEENPAKWHERVDHCVEVLRQKLEWYAQIFISFLFSYPHHLTLLPRLISLVSYLHNSRLCYNASALKIRLLISTPVAFLCVVIVTQLFLPITGSRAGPGPY